MALTQDEKDILGAMVDMGQLKGEVRLAVGASDLLAREKIAEFKAQQIKILPMQIEGLTRNKMAITEQINECISLLTLLEE